VSLNQDRNWDIENSSLCINPNQISEDEPVTVNITESLEESLKNLNVSRNTELKIVELFKQYTNMLKEQNNLNFEEPNWEYLFNKRLQIKEKFKKLNIDLPEIHVLDDLGKNTVYKLKLKDLLKLYLNNDLLSLIENERIIYTKNKRNGHYFSIYDGSILNEHEYFKIYPDGLKIGLYADDIKIAGTKRFLLYLFLCELNPLIRSDPYHYLLWLACESIVVKEIGFDAIFELLIPELLDLSDGITITIEDKQKTLYGYLYGIIGDNEILNKIAGISTCFQKVFTTCRRCLQKVNKNSKELFHERSKELTIQLVSMKIPKLTTYSGITHDSWVNYIADFYPEKQIIPDISHDINGGEIPRQLFSTLSALINENIITLDQYNQTWKKICNELNLNRFLTMPEDIQYHQLFYVNNENNYKNTFKFYESYIRLLTFPLILYLIVGDEEIFENLHVHRFMCFKTFFHLLMKRHHTEESLDALGNSYNTVLDNNMRCGYKSFHKTHSPKHYKTYIKELGTLRAFITNAGENSNQLNKNFNYSTKNVCYSLLINFVIRFKPFSLQNMKQDVKLSKYNIIDTNLYKDLEPCIGKPKCRIYDYLTLFGLKITRGSYIKMNDSTFIVVRSIFQNINSNEVFIYGQICKLVTFDDILQYRSFSELGEYKLFSLNAIDQIVYCYTHKDKTYMIISFDRFLIKNAMLDENK